MAKSKRGATSGAAARRKKRKAASVIETRAKKEFTLRGHTMSEIQAMPFDEQVDLLPSRARRSIGRGMSHDQMAVLKRVRGSEAGKGKIRTHRRDLVILPEMVGYEFEVYSGKEFRGVTVTPEMMGHALGEFVPTRGLVKHGGVGVGATRGSKHLPLK